MFGTARPLVAVALVAVIARDMLSRDVPARIALPIDRVALMKRVSADKEHRAFAWPPQRGTATNA